MKRLIYGTFLLVIFLASVDLWAAPDLYLAGQEFMPLNKATTLWGQAAFTSDKFMSGDLQARRSMAVSLVKSKTFVGKTAEQVKDALGDPNGYFWSKDIPAYFLTDGPKEKNRETWQLVFLPDSNGKIGEVRIHKNCCSKGSAYDPTRLSKTLNDIKDENGKKP